VWVAGFAARGPAGGLHDSVSGGVGRGTDRLFQAVDGVGVFLVPDGDGVP
jgi:hypothetical protein